MAPGYLHISVGHRGGGELSPTVREVLVDPAHDVFLSAVSVWETAGADKTTRVWDVQLDDGMLEQWSEIAERSPFVLNGIAVMPRSPRPDQTPTDASALPDAPHPPSQSVPPPPIERPAATRTQLP